MSHLRQFLPSGKEEKTKLYSNRVASVAFRGMSAQNLVEHYLSDIPNAILIRIISFGQELGGRKE